MPVPPTTRLTANVPIARAKKVRERNIESARRCLTPLARFLIRSPVARGSLIQNSVTTMTAALQSAMKMNTARSSKEIATKPATNGPMSRPMRDEV